MIAAEERDIVYLRTNARDERVYRYPVDVDQELMQAMLLKYIEKANDLARNPAFYNTLTSIARRSFSTLFACWSQVFHLITGFCSPAICRSFSMTMSCS